MPGYDSWKTRSPDNDLSGEQPTPEQERADWEDEMQQRADRGEPRPAWVDATALQAAHEIVALPENWTNTRKKAAIQTIVAREMIRALVPHS